MTSVARTVTQRTRVNLPESFARNSVGTLLKPALRNATRTQWKSSRSRLIISFHGDHFYNDLVHKRDTAATNEYVMPCETSYAIACV